MVVVGPPATGALRSRGCCDRRSRSHMRPCGGTAGLCALSAYRKRAAVIRLLMHRYDPDTANLRKQRALIDLGVGGGEVPTCTRIPNPRSRSIFFAILFCVSPARFDGPAARCGANHFRGLCHWAGELTAHQAAEPTSRRVTERASARKLSPGLVHTNRKVIINAPSEMSCPYAAVFRLSPPLVAHSFAHSICSGQSHSLSLPYASEAVRLGPESRRPLGIKSLDR